MDSEAADTQEMTLLRNKVTEAEIAHIVARWTGIPVDKMMEGEKDKLLQMESIIHHTTLFIANITRRRTNQSCY
jgi:ATP-dependent Clp protease ATP-binding subunit ClpB